MLHLPPIKMVVVAQLVRAPDCGSGGRRFEPGLPPVLKAPLETKELFFAKKLILNRVEDRVRSLS